MGISISKRRGKLTLLPLAAATYCMSAGGPYGIEELVQNCGYPLALAILFIVPVIWSLPVGLMVGELSAAIPAEGGFYVWVRRAMGPFWGFQEAWLSLMASVFDMAVYPTIFVLSLGGIWPAATRGYNGFLIGVCFVLLCVVWNLCGARAVGEGSLVLGALLLSPFLLLVVFALFRHDPVLAGNSATQVPAHRDLLAAILVTMWNYMGWDNASTIAGEVEDPQRTYPRGLLIAVAAAFLCYVIPVAAVWSMHVPLTAWATGSWVNIAVLAVGPWLGIAVLVSTMIGTLGSFNSLTLTLSRLPMALAEDGHAPALFTRRLANGVPWAALVACAIAWIIALRLTFDRLVMLDILLYGASLVLEFLALVLLRIREPELHRPFSVPGGPGAAILLGIGPTVLLIGAAVRTRSEQMGHVSAFAIGLTIMAAGVVAYFLGASRRSRISGAREDQPGDSVPVA